MADLDTFPPRRNEPWGSIIDPTSFAGVMVGAEVYSDDEAYESDISYDDERPDLFWVSRIIMYDDIYDDHPPSSDLHPPQTSL